MLSRKPTHQENMSMKCIFRDNHMDILVSARSITRDYIIKPQSFSSMVDNGRGLIRALLH